MNWKLGEGLRMNIRIKIKEKEALLPDHQGCCKDHRGLDWNKDQQVTC